MNLISKYSKFIPYLYYISIIAYASYKVFMISIKYSDFQMVNNKLKKRLF